MNFKLPFVILISYVAAPSMGQVDSSIGSTGVPFPKEDLKNLDEKPTLDQSTSLTTRSGPPVGLASRLNQLEAEFREKMEDIETQTSKSIKDQNDKIAKVTGWEYKLAQLLNQSMEVMRELKTQNRDHSKRIDLLEQKVATIQNTPAAKDKLKNGALKNNDGQVSKDPTPPSSCEELAMLDHHLNGLYLVKNKQTKKIQTVFCKFSADKVSQDLIGQIDVKTKTVHFYAQRNYSLGTASGAVIPFHVAPVNEGGAFNLRSGVFTAPVNGFYHFQFSAIKDYHALFLAINLQLNGANVGVAYTHAGQTVTGNHASISLSASLRLAAADRVYLINGNGVLYDDNTHNTHFSGWLVEEEFM